MKKNLTSIPLVLGLLFLPPSHLFPSPLSTVFPLSKETFYEIEKRLQSQGEDHLLLFAYGSLIDKESASQTLDAKAIESFVSMWFRSTYLAVGITPIDEWENKVKNKEISTLRKK